MADITVEQLAKMVGIPAKQLLLRLRDAGVKVKDTTETITNERKNLLLNYIKSTQTTSTQSNVAPTLKLKKSTTSIPSGKNVINVTVRKRRAHYDVDKVLEEEEKKAKLCEEARLLEEEISKKAKSEKEAVKTKKGTEKQLEIISEPKKTGEVEPARAKVRSEVIQPKKKVAKGVVARHRDKDVEQVDAEEVSVPSSTPRVVREITIPETLTVAELAQKMAIKATEVIKIMMNMGAMATINQALDQDTATLVAEEMGFKTKLLKETVLEDSLCITENVEDAELLPRAPVVTIMGHVDHGKTSLLDYIRRTKVAIREAGGITQHIGAYHVETPRGMITFLDTPGHAAFTAIRARGAKCTDIVILVVAADDGVMPQTVEAIQHAQAAKVPLIVAINKIDKPEANPEKIKTELTKYNIVSEDWGGDTMFQNISAKTGEGIDQLLDSILIMSEMQELKAPVECLAKGVIIEAHLDKGRGPVASILVQRGTLYQGDIVLTGLHYGKIRAMFDDAGKKVTSATPSMPVEILGLSGVPSAGDEAFVTESEKKAREIALFRQGKYRDIKLAKQQAAKLENILSNMKEDGVKILNVILKTDVHGSAEAITEFLNKLNNEEVKIKVVSSGVGGINESDINLALVSSGIVIGFNVRADVAAKNLAEREGVDLRYYSVIYNLVDDIKAALTGLLAPKYDEEVTGLAEVREVFRSSKFGTIAGCMVLEGAAKRGSQIRILRDNVVIYQGELESLRKLKEDVNEVRQGMECGIGIKGYNDFKVGDQIEVYKSVLVKRTIEL